MHRASVLAALGMLGCGRLGFGSTPRVDGGADGPMADAPPVPAAICKVDRIPITPPPPAADLTIAPTAEGYVAFWVDTAAVAAVHAAHAMMLGPNHAVLRSAPLPDITDLALGGAADAGQKLVLASSNGKDETLWIVERDLSKATAQSTLSGRLLGRDPYPSDAGQKDRAFVTAHSDKIEISLVNSDGTVNLGGPRSSPPAARSASSRAPTAPATRTACGPTSRRAAPPSASSPTSTTWARSPRWSEGT